LCNSETGECYILSVVSDQLAQQAVDDGLNSKDVTAIAASIAVGTILVVLMVLVFLYCKRRVDANGSLAAAYSAVREICLTTTQDAWTDTQTNRKTQTSNYRNPIGHFCVAFTARGRRVVRSDEHYGERQRYA
jgi:hypothetical protein